MSFYPYSIVVLPNKVTTSHIRLLELKLNKNLKIKFFIHINHVSTAYVAGATLLVSHTSKLD